MNLNREAAEAAYQQWMDLDVVHIEYHREATGGGPVEMILAAAQEGTMSRTEIQGGEEDAIKGDGRMEPRSVGKHDAEPINWKDPLHLPWPQLWRVAGFVFTVTFALTIILFWLADVFPI